VQRNRSCAARAHLNFRCHALAKGPPSTVLVWSFRQNFEEAHDLLVDNGHVDNGDDIFVMTLQNLTKARQARDAGIKEICDGSPSHYTEEQALRRCQDKGALTRLALINDRIRIVEDELVSCGRAYRVRLGDIVVREPMRRWALLVLSFVGAVRCSCGGSRSANSPKLPPRGCGYLKIFLFGKTAWICLRRDRGTVDEEKTLDTSDDDAR
jgi:hypothetical protein